MAKMGNKTTDKTFKPKIRQVGGLTIVFESRESVYVRNSHFWTTYHRFFCKLQKNRWHNFTDSLARNGNINSDTISRLAARSGVTVSATEHPPDLKSKTYKILPENGRERNK